MKDQQASYPQLRFKGFTDPWEQRKLSDVANHRGGTAIEKYFDKDGVYKVISIGSYGLNSQYVDQNIRAISNEITDGRVVNSGELTMVLNDKTANGSIIGRTLLVEKDNEYVINQRTEIISPKENFDSNFAYTILNGPFREKVKRIVQGGTQIYVNYPAVSNLDLELPKIEEQQKIGTFFKQLDRLIALHQRKLAKLKELKQGYLQKLFPRNGSKFPQLRFSGFSDAWERRKLKSLLKLIVDNRGKTPPTHETGSHPMLEVNSLGGLFPNYSKVKKYVNDKVFSSWFRNYLAENDVLFSTVGNTGLTSLMDKNTNAVIAQNIIAFRFIPEVYPIFAVQMFKQFGNLKKAKRIEMGAVQPSIKVTQLVKIKYDIPDFDEQKVIGKFLKHTDQLIAANQRKLEKLQELKKGYLQKMFC